MNDPRSPSTRETLARGVALLRAGKPGDAAALFGEGLTRDPEHPDLLHLLGVAKRQAGDPAAAIELINRASGLQPANPIYRANLGTALEAAGRPEDALAAYRQAIALKADYPEALVKLGRLAAQREALPEAEAALLTAARLEPQNGDTLLRLGQVLKRQKKGGPALTALIRAAKLLPASAEAQFEVASLLDSGGKRQEATRFFERTVALAPSHDNALFQLTLGLMIDGRLKEALETCNRLLVKAPGNRRLLSVKAILLTELGRRDEAAELLDFERFIKPTDVPPPDGFAGLAAFNAALAEEVIRHPSLQFEKQGHATRHGGHTGDLLKGQRGPAALALEAAIRAAVADYIAALPDDPRHPFSASKPQTWDLTAWAVVMETKGHQVPHIHPAAWLSGVYYAELPPEMKRAENGREGWLEFGRPQENYPTKAEPLEAFYRPQEGRMFLFPSYFYHATVPLESAKRRISIAFDVIPKG